MAREIAATEAAGCRVDAHVLSEQEMDQSSAENADCLNEARSASPGSIGFVVIAANSAGHTAPVLDLLWQASHENDEIILLMRSDRLNEAPREGRPWLRVVGVDTTDLFHLRSQIPTVSNKEWLFILEDHAFVSSAAITAVRASICAYCDINLIAVLTKNLTSIAPWDWASYLHGLAEIWAPLDHKPPFALATSALVRRAALGTERPLQEGEWEFRVIPQLFSSGRYLYDNDIYIDHVKALGIASHLLLNFHNNRVCAAIQRRRFGMSIGTLCNEAWSQAVRRPRRIARVIEPRRSDLPRSTLLRIRIVALASALGTLVGTLLGEGRSANKLD